MFPCSQLTFSLRLRLIIVFIISYIHTCCFSEAVHVGRRYVHRGFRVRLDEGLEEPEGSDPRHGVLLGLTRQRLLSGHRTGLQALPLPLEER